MHRKLDNRALKQRQMAFKAEEVTDSGTFSGYGSVFGNVDSYREIVSPGAFKNSIKAIKDSGDPLPALWQHRSSEPIGGYTELREDEKGLYVEGFLLKDEIPRAAEAFALMKRRVVKGMSIGYYVLDESWNEKDRILTLKELELVEVSIVTFPANELAQVDAVKSMESLLRKGQMPTLPEFEKFLRDAGFSKAQATAVAGHGLRKLLDQREAEGDTAGVIATLNSFKL